MSDHFDDAYAAFVMTGAASATFQSILDDCVPALQDLTRYDPLALVATFGGLLLAPELQSNCIRLEALAHICLATARGTRRPNRRLTQHLFEALGSGACGRSEDPAEDVHVSSIATPRGNFRVLEGTWESGGFCLQRIVNVVEKMPRGSGYDILRNSVYSLLSLSELACERAGLARNRLGNDLPQQSLPIEITVRLQAYAAMVRFSEEELSEAGISLTDLSAFGFNPTRRTELLTDRLGNSSLERYPVVHRKGTSYLALPTAVSAAIRRFVIEQMETSGMREAFLRGLAREYSHLFSLTPLLGGSQTRALEFRRTATGLIGGVMRELEPGRFINMIFLIDTLEDFSEDGLVGFNPELVGLDASINHFITHAYETALQTGRLEDGLSLLVPCGVGRGIAISFDRVDRPNWRFESISAADLYTLSWTEDFKPLSLFRVLEAQDKGESLGVTLQNINGLLNLIAWISSLQGHLVPHGELPDDFASERHAASVMIPQNALRELRHDVASTWDLHVEADITGRWITVRKDARSLFDEDRAQPLYVPEELEAFDGIPAVYVTPVRPWWCRVEVVANRETGHSLFQRWQMMTTWLARAAPILEREFPALPPGPLLLVAQFQGGSETERVPASTMTFVEALDSISVARRQASELAITFRSEFDYAHYNADNTAEQALVSAIVRGAALLSEHPLEEHEQLRIVKSIVPGLRARQTHMFQARYFRDYIETALPPKPIAIDKIESATLRLGLGWAVRKRSDGATIRGQRECLAYLKDLVTHIESLLCERLRLFGKEVTIRCLLQNHEAAVVDRSRWSRTAAAILELHDDKQGTMQTMADHEFELNAVVQATRLLSEIALCESPASSERVPSSGDLSQMMATIMLIQQFGGWSDAIRWEVMEPNLRVTPLGDVHANLGFIEEVLMPFGHVTATTRILEAVDNYATNVSPPTVAPSAEHAFEPQFLVAWQDEAGGTIDEFRLFIDYVEDLGIRRSEAVLVLAKSDLTSEPSVDGRVLPTETAMAIVNFLTLRSRPSWTSVPSGYVDSDRQPWRFRRALSVLRRPIFQLDDAQDPTVVIAPGILRDAFLYTLGNFHRGDLPHRQLRPAMASWAGTTRAKIGEHFNIEVATRLKELGWEVEPQLRVTKLLRRGLDRDFGDIDVFAWMPASGRVLVIECKDVQFRKTYGEIAEQLADFRGITSSDGIRDYLRRHLDRVDVVTAHLTSVAKYLDLARLERVESHLVFRNPVPMEFALKHMAEQVRVSTYDNLHTI